MMAIATTTVLLFQFEGRAHHPPGSGCRRGEEEGGSDEEGRVGAAKKGRRRRERARLDVSVWDREGRGIRT